MGLFENTTLPVLQVQGEKNWFILLLKNTLQKWHTWVLPNTFSSASDLAYWLYLFDRKDEALEVCRHFTRYEFNGDHNFWTWVEILLVLQIRICREYDFREEAEHCRKRIVSADPRIEAGTIQDFWRGCLESDLQSTQRPRDGIGERMGRFNYFRQAIKCEEFSPEIKATIPFGENVSRLVELAATSWKDGDQTKMQKAKASELAAIHFLDGAVLGFRMDLRNRKPCVGMRFMEAEKNMWWIYFEDVIHFGECGSVGHPVQEVSVNECDYQKPQNPNNLYERPQQKKNARTIHALRFSLENYSGMFDDSRMLDIIFKSARVEKQVNGKWVPINQL